MCFLDVTGWAPWGSWAQSFWNRGRLPKGVAGKPQTHLGLWRQEIGGFRRLARSALTKPWCTTAGAVLRTKGVAWNCGVVKEAMARHNSQVSQPLQGGLKSADAFSGVLTASRCMGQSSGMVDSVALVGSARDGLFKLLALTCAVAICIPIAVPAQPRKGSKQIKKMTNNTRITR